MYVSLKRRDLRGFVCWWWKPLTLTRGWYSSVWTSTLFTDSHSVEFRASHPDIYKESQTRLLLLRTVCERLKGYWCHLALTAHNALHFIRSQQKHTLMSSERVREDRLMFLTLYLIFLQTDPLWCSRQQQRLHNINLDFQKHSRCTHRKTQTLTVLIKKYYNWIIFMFWNFWESFRKYIWSTHITDASNLAEGHRIASNY